MLIIIIWLLFSANYVSSYVSRKINIEYLQRFCGLEHWLLDFINVQALNLIVKEPLHFLFRDRSNWS